MNKELNRFAIEVTQNSLNFLENMKFTVTENQPWDNEQFEKDRETFDRMFNLLERFKNYNENNN